LNILLIPENYPTDLQPNGAVFMEDQVKVLREMSSLTMFNTNPWYRGAYRQIEGVRYFDFHVFEKKWVAPFNMLAYVWWERQSIRLGKKLPKPDIIHLHGASLRGRIATALANHWNVPLVITEHTGPWSAVSARPMVFSQAKKSMESATCICPVSHHLKEEILKSGIHPKQIQVLGNPVDTAFFALREKPLNEKRTILFLGRLDPFKGAMRTLRAFHKAMPDLPGWSLTIAGEGTEADEIKRYIAEHQLQDRASFSEGFFTRAEMRSFFYDASFLVFPSEFESFGLVGAEAMSTGLPLLVTDRTGPVDYFAEGCGIPVDPGDVDAIATGMQAMVSQLSLFDSSLIRRQIEDNFGYRAFAKKLSKLNKNYTD
jgi:glycosyltransferase involved in cell wall biosynthesis